mgnify:CR=1
MTDEEGLDLLHKQMEFSGCKIALLCDDKLLTSFEVFYIFVLFKAVLFDRLEFIFDLCYN